MKFESVAMFFTGMLFYLVGGVDLAMRILLIFVVADLVTGFLKAWKLRQYTSRQFREGLVNKSCYFIMLILAYQLDLMAFGGTPTVRVATTFFYIWVEASSILENLGEMGAKIPPILAERMDKIKDLTSIKEK